MMPKRVVDVMASEVMRGVRMSAKQLEYVQFKVPRKTGGFAKELYPDWKSDKPAHDFESYKSGVNKEPLREEVQSQERVVGAKKANFMNKLAGSKDNQSLPSKPLPPGITPEIRALLDEKDSESQELKNKVTGLEAHIAELQAQLAALQQ